MAKKLETVSVVLRTDLSRREIFNMRSAIWNHTMNTLKGFGSHVGVVFFIIASHLCDRSWSEFQSISTWLEGVLPGTPVFLPLQNRLPVKNIWPGCCAPGSCMTVWRQPEEPFICIRPIPSELRPLQFSPRGCKSGWLPGHFFYSVPSSRSTSFTII